MGRSRGKEVGSTSDNLIRGRWQSWLFGAKNIELLWQLGGAQVGTVEEDGALCVWSRFDVPCIG